MDEVKSVQKAMSVLRSAGWKISRHEFRGAKVSIHYWLERGEERKDVHFPELLKMANEEYPKQKEAYKKFVEEYLKNFNYNEETKRWDAK